MAVKGLTELYNNNNHVAFSKHILFIEEVRELF